MAESSPDPAPTRDTRLRRDRDVLAAVGRMYLGALDDDPENEMLTLTEALRVTEIRDAVERAEVGHDPMPECESCVHWEKFEPALYGYIGHIPEAETPRWGRCRKVSDMVDKPWDVEVIAFTQDGSDYSSHLRCRADFGCVLWSDNPEDAASEDDDA